MKLMNASWLELSSTISPINQDSDLAGNLSNVVDRVFHPMRASGLISGLLVASSVLCSVQVHAFDIGFQGLLQLEASDNVTGANTPDTENGIIQSAVLGVFGGQESRWFSGGFAGELDTRKVASNSDSDIDSISRFLGAADFKLTPRSWTWYVGDVLGGIRIDNGIQPIDDAEIERRNLFVTGPGFERNLPGISRTNARLLYVNQTQDNEAIEDLYIANFSYQRDLTTQSQLGVRLGNIFTDLPDENVVGSNAMEREPDFNRASLSMFYDRQIGFFSISGELGITYYDTDAESLKGLNSEIRLFQRWGPRSGFSLYVQRNLNDQSLSAAESLVQSGDTAVGVSPSTAGIFFETRLGVDYNLQALDTRIAVGIGVSELDYQLLSGGASASLFNVNNEDRSQGFFTASWVQRLSNRIRSELSLSYETQDFDNRVDNSNSLLLQALVNYELTRSFDFQLGFIRDNGSGVQTLLGEDGLLEEPIDITENRLTLGLRWTPVSRANQELAVELQSLLR
ncbi:MAG: hypothetical protein AB8B97_14825 [Granulosicoccus sp.]